MGFFNLDYGVGTSNSFNSNKQQGLREPLCMKCPLNGVGCLTPKMQPTGEFKQQMMVVAEAPGCIHGDTFIYLPNPYSGGVVHVKIKDLVDRTPFNLYAFDLEQKKLVIDKAIKVWCTGRKQTYTIAYQWLDSNGDWMLSSIIATENHPFLVYENNKYYYKSVKDGLQVGDRLVLFDDPEIPVIVMSIAKGEVEEVYDIEVEKHHNFVANSVIIHNSEEDKRGVQLIGKSGQYLRKTLKKFNFDLDRDFIKLNAVNCRPPKNRTPTNQEIQCCKPMVLGTIYEKKPKVILLMGAVALKSVLGEEWTKDLDTFTSWVGFLIPSRKFNAWLAPIYHPSFVLRERDRNPVLDLLFEKQIKKALEYRDKPLPSFKSEVSCSKLLLTDEEVTSKLKEILAIAREKKIALAFDYETSGLKPHASNHYIACVSFSYNFDEAYAFWMTKNRKIQKLWKRILVHPNIMKIAHNMKYEDTWTYHILGYRPKPWYWDTMLVAHIIDNRSNIVSLKKQSYIHFGLVGYDDDVKKYLKAQDSNARNKIDTAPKQKILLYNAIDSLATFRLFCYQHAIIHGFKDRNGLTNLKLRPFKPYVEED